MKPCGVEMIGTIAPRLSSSAVAAVPYWFSSWKKTCNSHAVLGSGTGCAMSNGRKYHRSWSGGHMQTAQHPPFSPREPPARACCHRPSDFLRIAQLGEPRTPSWVQEAYVKRVFVVEKIPPGRQPLWDRKNQSRARSSGRYQNVTLIIASHTKLRLQSWALLYGLRHNSGRILSSCRDLNEEDRSLNFRRMRSLRTALDDCWHFDLCPFPASGLRSVRREMQPRGCATPFDICLS